MRSIAKAILPILLLSSAASAAELPATIAAAGETTVLTVHAVGQQLYDCKPGADGKLVWSFNSPQATLTVDGKVVGHHGAGPSWELDDGSSIVGIPWLKLEVVSHNGSGKLSDVTTVQRINTVGGVLKDTCDRQGAGRGMPYSADYVFLKKG
jgi:Protein of unknown function (DUF3455)